ncbi:hypothetical protein N9500_00780 [Candidatus Pelagibacter sp.]|nr:hypothetical protein [Candidatus Pelagibacter sp.]
MNTFKSFTWFSIVIFLGISARIYISTQGYNADMDAWRVNVDLFLDNGDFYKNGRYNYTPFWINILVFLDSLPSFNLNSFDSLRIKVVLFLSLIDVIIFILLKKNYSLKIGILFFLNPITIFITGFHNHFDNLAVLLGFIAVLIYEKNNKNFGFIFCSLLLGISLCAKHILFLFPIWIAYKEKNFIKKFLIIFIPYLIFLFSFWSYLPEQLDSILKNVFLYSSWDNGPFWGIFAPYFIHFFIPKKILFISSLLLLGLFLKKKSIKEIFYFYLIAMIVLSSSIANQYLVIPVMAMAIFWNSFYGVYTVACSMLFLVDRTALKIEWLSNYLNWNPGYSRYSYYVIIFFLSIGFLKTLIGKKKFDKVTFQVSKILKVIFLNIKEQLSIKR